MNAAESLRRRRAASPVGRIVLALVVLLGLVVASRADAGDGAGGPAFSLMGASGIFGKQSPGTEWQKMTEDAKRGSRYRYDGPAGSELYKVTGTLRGAPSEDGVQTVDVAVYADQDGNPGPLLAQSAENAAIAGRQAAKPVDFPLTQPVPLEPGKFYWLMYHAGSGNDVAEYSYGIANNALRFEQKGQDLKADGADDPAGPMAADAKEVAIWGSYRPSATGPAPRPDRDADGVVDADDLCPDVPGPAGAAGCPALTSPTPPGPPAPRPPRATTLPAQDVTADSATLTGFVVTQGDTAWFFQWGTKPVLGRRTATQVRRAAEGDIQVEMPLARLRPDTRYYYRLVAEGPGGRVLGKTKHFTSLPFPEVELQFFMSLRCNPRARFCPVARSRIEIGLRESGGRLARPAQHADLRVRVAIRRGGRVAVARTFRAGARVSVRPFGGSTRVRLRQDVARRISRYDLSDLFRTPITVGTAVEVSVTRGRTIGGFARIRYRRGYVGQKESCVIPVGARVPRDCADR